MTLARPEFHYTPGRNWMNDPNGLIHHDGRWHLFYQYNPYGDEWGNMSWGHASSPDLHEWTEHPVAIHCTEDEHVWSGSTVSDGDTLTAIYTARAADGGQAQALATSTDTITWTRYPGNPVLDRGSSEFRDPKVFRYRDHWVMVAVEAEKHLVLLYRSDDLVRWELLDELNLDLGGRVRAIECPDLFPLPYKDGEVWVLIVSLIPDLDSPGSATRYCLGDFDGTRFTPVTSLRRVDDGPDCYAAATFNDAPDGRRVAIAWMNSWAYAAQVPTSPWRGAMTLPRELSLAEHAGEPVLAQTPLAAPEPIVVDISKDGSFEIDGVRLTWSGGELNFERDVFPASATVGLPYGPLRVYRDHGSVEIFSADGTLVITALTSLHAE